jgi:ABC-type uncharacterized transport system substrate-binding protein
MKRTGIGLTLSALLLGVCLPAVAQQPKKVPRIGYLSSTDPATDSIRSEPFRAALRELGYLEGQNIAIEYRYSQGKRDRHPKLVAELVGLKVDLIVVAGGTTPIRAARNATKTIPIVGVSLGDPVANGLVASLASPGGNLTGFTAITDELWGKRLELIKETVPKLSLVGLLWNSGFPDSARARKLYQATADALRLQLHSLEVTRRAQLEPAFKEAVRTECGAVAMTGGAFLAANLKNIADLAVKYRLPAIADRDDFVDRGGLMSYGSDDGEKFQRVAAFIDKILKGAKPADITVEQPSKFELVFNLKTAKAIGLNIPPDVLARANRVIR